MPKVSIIIPTYNSSHFLARTVASVLRQSYTDWELLLIDDASSDQTVEIAEKLATADKRIKVYQLEYNSGGPATSKNLGWHKAQGEFIAFLDHDDEWLPEKLTQQLVILESSSDPRLGLVSCSAYLKDESRRKSVVYQKNYQTAPLADLANGNFIISSSCVLVKREVFQTVGGFDTTFKIFDDWDMWLRLAEADYSFAFLETPLVNYLVHADNACRNNHRLDEEEFIKVYEKHRPIFERYSPKKTGVYYFYKKDYQISRKYLWRSFFSASASWSQRLVSLAYIILPLWPGFEKNFKWIFVRLGIGNRL